MASIIEMQARKKEIVAKMDSMLTLVDSEKRSLTPDEEKEYEKNQGELDKVTEEIKAEQRMQDRKERITKEKEDLKKVEKPFQVNIVGKAEDETQFRNIGEYFHAIVVNPRDKRLMELREQTMGTGTGGGFAMPEQFKADLLQVSPQDAIVRSKAMVIPAGSPPDAKLTIPALDQTSARNIYGGVTMVHTGEGVTMTETQAYLREVTLEPKEISAYIVATNKLLENWDAASMFITTQLRKAMAGQEDYDFLRGDGVNKAMGVINSPAAITNTRSAANTIAWADVYGMYAKAKFGGTLVWLASQTIIPQLAAMVDAGSHAVWISGAGLGTGAAQSIPSTLMGLPLYFCDRLPALGTTGDIILCDLGYYLIKDGSGPFAGVSEHVYSTSNKTCFKIVWNVDGKSWLTEPLAIEGVTTSFVSPFIMLS